MRVLVTGGGGFLGRAIVERLVARGDEVSSLSRGHYADLDALGVRQHRADLVDAASVKSAVRGCEAVFHVAALAGVAGKRERYVQANIIGTRNVLAACRAAGAGYFVHTSSPSVVFDGRDIAGADESLPYPTKYKAHYPETKAIAEREVLAATDHNLSTVALRPHLIWGPRDNHLTPRILDRGRKGQLRRIGRGNPLIDSTYIDNAADAHLAALDSLVESDVAAGKAYFVSNDEPMPLWNLVNAILAAGDLPPVTRHVPKSVAYAAGWFLERVYALLERSDEPRMTRFVASELSTAHWFDITAARHDLGYEPKVSIGEGLERLRAWLHESPTATSD